MQWWCLGCATWKYGTLNKLRDEKMAKARSPVLSLLLKKVIRPSNERCPLYTLKKEALFFPRQKDTKKNKNEQVLLSFFQFTILSSYFVSHHISPWPSLSIKPSITTVYEILQAWMLEWVAIPSSRGSSWPRDRTCVSHVSCTGRQILYYWGSCSRDMLCCA